MLLLPHLCFKAQNLVPNPSFEEFTSCPSNTGHIDSALHWYSPTGATSDLCNSCANIPDDYVGVPNNQWGNQAAMDGVGYAHIISYYPYNLGPYLYREYVQVKLTESLDANRKHIVSFFVSLSETSRWAIDGMGAYLSATPISGPYGRPLNSYTPQIRNPDNYTLGNKQSWVEIKGEYIAQGGEEYITIGNFKDDGPSLKIVTVKPTGRSSSYYLDLVSVIPIRMTISEDAYICPGETVILKADSSETYHWVSSDDLSQRISSSKRISVSPSRTTTYYCYGSIDTVSVTVFVTDNKFTGLPNDTMLCQNENLIIDATTPNATYSWSNGSTKPNIAVDSSGEYSVKVLVNGCEKKDTIRVSYTTPPKINFSDDTTLCKGDALFVGEISDIKTDFLWPDLSINSSITVNEEGLYWLEAKNRCGSDRDSIQILIENCECIVNIPNIFSPNFDKINDQISPQIYCNLESFKFKIFNRWGKIVFYSLDSNLKWDGYSNEKLCNPGVYYYTVEYSSNNLNYLQKGFITLVQ